MDDNRNVRESLSGGFNLLDGKSGMHRAVPLPQNHFGVDQLLRRVAAQWLEGIPDDHFIQGNPQLEGGVTAQVLVGQEQDSLTMPKGPLHDLGGVGRGADRTVVPAAQRFDASDGVHVGDGNYAAFVLQQVLEIIPGVIHVFHGGHVRHGAARGDIGQDHFLVRGAQDARGLGHEVDAAENDVLRILLGCGLLGQKEGIPLVVGVLDYLFPLVMVAQNGNS